MKTGVIKTVSLNGRTLEHSRYRDFMGMLHDVFDMTETIAGQIVHTPMMPPPKTNSYTKETPIFELGCNDYSQEEMLDVLKKLP